jgi:acetylornithine deacetylase/succinyl-diaminopimelate desuccinylase-like protein
MLQAGDELAREGFIPPRDIYFMSTCCEETTGAGANKISQVLLERGIRFELVLDEGGMIVDEPMSGAKGRFAMKAMQQVATKEAIAVASRTAEGSMPASARILGLTARM